jgi:hypothetical protein
MGGAKRRRFVARIGRRAQKIARYIVNFHIKQFDPLFYFTADPFERLDPRCRVLAARLERFGSICYFATKPIIRSFRWKRKEIFSATAGKLRKKSPAFCGGNVAKQLFVANGGKGRQLHCPDRRVHAGNQRDDNGNPTAPNAR